MIIRSISLNFLRLEPFRTKFVEKIETHYPFHNPPTPRKSCRLWETVENLGAPRQATHDSVMLRRKDAICIPDNRTLIIFDSYAFPRKHWLRESASALPYTYIASLVKHVYKPAVKSKCIFALSCRPVCMEDLCNHSTHFLQVLCWWFLPKSADEIQF